MSARILAIALLLMAFAAPAPAQDPSKGKGETERKLETVKRELQRVAAERRRIEGERGDVTKQLRTADEKVGKSNRVLRETEVRLAGDQRKLAQLQQQRAAMQATLGARREELARLLRAAYAQGEAAPLKALLSQDRIADANRAMTYQRYVQADRARRIAELGSQLREIDALEAEIVARQNSLDQTRRQQRQQLGQLEQDRRTRAALLAQLDEKYQDRREREQALGRDAKGLERVLKQLRAAAARAEAERRAAATRAARDAVTGNRNAPHTPVVPAAPPLQVGGLGWPLSGSLLAGYGGTMPDGRGSQGLLIAANAGAPIKAVADGTVVYAEWMTGYGLLLIIDHGNGYMSLYAHNDALLKDVGAAVKRGDAVATVGNSGGHGRPSLYFELRRNGQPVNPGTWLR
ncbi:murein hydrolase activator EnvC family protein [Lysobacter niabensis]|uniref:murein hydrolase activator EnvC family protein n=1 Tax=Agrilutibacter niabensis TaxID=380628 RepID=UPI00360D4042